MNFQLKKMLLRYYYIHSDIFVSSNPSTTQRCVRSQLPEQISLYKHYALRRFLIYVFTQATVDTQRQTQEIFLVMVNTWQHEHHHDHQPYKEEVTLQRLRVTHYYVLEDFNTRHHCCTKKTFLENFLEKEKEILSIVNQWKLTNP